MTTIDVDAWSKTAAKEYLTTGKPLDDVIEKIASDHGLNKDQISRVVEASNTEVYVQMFNQSADKYIQFNNADSEKIAARIFGEEKVSHVSDSDYQEVPSYSYSIEDEQAEALLTKTAELIPENHTNSEAIHEYYKIAALETRLGQSMDEVEALYQNDTSILYSMIKQAVLSGTGIGDITKALTSIYDDPIVRINILESQEKLASEIYPRKLDTSEHSIGTVNMDNPLVKQAGLLLKHAQNFKTLKAKRTETLGKLKNHLKTGTLKSVTTALGVGAIGGAIGVDQIRKKRNEQALVGNKMSYLPNGPGR